jgi:DNA-binding Lrp family transcriptional regulator
MIKLDKKDRLILYHLIINSRQQIKTIGEKVGLSKETTGYRINRLIKNGVIKKFTLFINFRNFGYSEMMTHYKFKNINPIIKKEIIDFLVKTKYSLYVSLVEGMYDLQVDFLLGDPIKFERYLDEIREKFCSYLSFESSKFYMKGEFYFYYFLLDDIYRKVKPYKWDWGSKLVYVDDLDLKILLELTKDSRMQIKNIAKNINSTVSIVNYRIKKLEHKLGYNYTINIDWSKIGYRWFHLQINLRDYSRKNDIINYLSHNPNLIRRFKFLNLDLDLHFTFLLNNMEQLRNIVEDITNRFPDTVNDYNFYSTYKIFKYQLLVPELLKIKNPISREF